MKLSIAALVLLAGVWLGLWVGNTGVLVYSGDTRIPKTRECHYFIGVSVLKRIEPLAERCMVFRTLGK